MKIPIWLSAICLAASLPATATEAFKPIELKDAEMAQLRGRYTLPGRIISFGVVMSSTWTNSNNARIGATVSMEMGQKNQYMPQFYVSSDKSNGSGNQIASGTGTVTGGAGLAQTGGVTQSSRSAGNFNTSRNNFALNVKESDTPDNSQPQGQALNGSFTDSSAAGTVQVTQAGGGVQIAIAANQNQGTALQNLGANGLLQATKLLGDSNLVSNLTELNVVLRNNMPSAGALNCNLDMLKNLRAGGI
ncbi:hypothetical protein [Pseudomonas citronellolis]|uniref:hypothetical protein n=1 Tax=Pseudomonas citronellolis TaxID=53408 RepID=UPI0023E39287|nr:hypothetical protein [Pseudomonas citronellolis]MDF3932340.1 hypothetical protein [Pseudomonas citronellolis]